MKQTTKQQHNKNKDSGKKMEHLSITFLKLKLRSLRKHFYKLGFTSGGKKNPQQDDNQK